MPLLVVSDDANGAHRMLEFSLFNRGIRDANLLKARHWNGELARLLVWACLLLLALAGHHFRIFLSRHAHAPGVALRWPVVVSRRRALLLHRLKVHRADGAFVGGM